MKKEQNDEENTWKSEKKALNNVRGREGLKRHHSENDGDVEAAKRLRITNLLNPQEENGGSRRGGRREEGQEEEKKLEYLYDVGCAIIQNIWPNHSISQKTQLCTLKRFIAETHRQSRLSSTIVEMGYMYLLRAKNAIKERQKRELIQSEIYNLQEREQINNSVRQRATDIYSSSSSTPIYSPITPEQGVGYTIKENSGLDLGIHTLVTENIIADSLPNDVKGFKLENILLPAQPSVSRQKADVTKCGRRMFVAALICASKFVMDRTYSNKAWSKVTGLDTAQINLMEFEFLKLLNYKLYVSDTSFNHWKTLLNYCRQNNNLFKCHKISSPSNSFTRSFSTPDYKFAAPSLIPDASKKPLNIITNTNLTDITTTNTNSANYSIIAFASSDRKIHC